MGNQVVLNVIKGNRTNKLLNGVEFYTFRGKAVSRFCTSCTHSAGANYKPSARWKKNEVLQVLPKALQFLGKHDYSPS